MRLPGFNLRWACFCISAAEWKKNPRQQPKKEIQKLDKGDWFEKLASGIIAVVLLAMLAV